MECVPLALLLLLQLGLQRMHPQQHEQASQPPQADLESIVQPAQIIGVVRIYASGVQVDRTRHVDFTSTRPSYMPTYSSFSGSSSSKVSTCSNPCYGKKVAPKLISTRLAKMRDLACRN